MVNIYNYLKNVFQDIKNQNSENSLFLLILLLLISIPLPYFINNILLAFLIIFSIKNYKKSNYNFSVSLVLPLILFGLMSLSYFWSIDKTETISAIPKEIALFVFPLAFLFNQKFSAIQLEKIKQYYSFSMVVLVIFFLIRAVIRYALFHDSRVFFYHGENDDDYGLVPKLLNAIHVSVFVALGFFYFFSKEVKTKTEILFSILLFGFIILLSSKNIILVVILLIFIHLFFFSKIAHKMRLRNLIIFGAIILVALSMGKIKERFKEEFRNNTPNSLSTNVTASLENGVHNISIYEAWNNEKFTPNDYFPGTAFRVYQARMFFELLKEEPIFLKGFGLNASKKMLLEKEKKYNLYSGYGGFNFHNQYIQNFAELGIIGFLLLLTMLFVNIKNAINTKDFVHFTFAILMISLFLTETFLWRQRGVVFFTLFYCLFNTNISQRKIIIE